MLARKRIAILVGLGIFAVAGAVLAQSDATQQKTLFDRLDDFGKTIFGGILPSDKDDTTKVPAPSTTPRRTVSTKSSYAGDSPDEGMDAPRAGSVLSGIGQRPPAQRILVRDSADVGPEDTAATARRSDGTPRVIRRPLADTSLMDDADATVIPPRQTAAGSSYKDISAASGDQSDLPGVSQPAPRPMHQRLAGFRQSAFGSEAEHEPAPPQPKLQPEGAPDASVPGVRAPSDSEPMTPHPARRPMVAQRTTLGVHGGPSSDVPSSTPPATDGGAAATNEPSAATNSPNGVLFARQGPALSVETVGPRTIAVGKESTYEVNIVNSAEVAAENLNVFVSLPEWTEVVGAQASAGTAQTTAAPQAGAILWKVGHLEARARQRLTIRLIPRQSRPFDLAVRWEYKPIASQAMIEVQEAKLALQLEGPREVLYGKKELYRLKLANTGNGNAENVVITLVPLAAGENVPASHKIGVLAAGEEKTLDVELTARQAGNLTIRAEARADGGLRVESAERVLVRRPELKVNVDGPKAQFVGTVATYAVTIRNPGNAPARNVNLSIALPTGAKYLSGIERPTVAAAGDKLQWTLETLSPESEQNFLLKCRLGATGVGRLQLVASADDDLAARAETVVQVDGVADLTLNVKDPAGPMPVGEETIYEVLVRNRGTKEAQGIEVSGYFSRGVEPTSAEGAPSRLDTGQVVFQPLASLAPGEEVVFKIHARAEVAGNHVFRAEVHCKPLGARLISEATNLYYGDNATGRQMAEGPSGERSLAPHEAMRPIPHPVQDDQPLVPRK